MGTCSVGVKSYTTAFSDAGWYAIRETVHKHCICGDGVCTVAGHSHEEVTWTAWTETDSLPDTAGNYYLANDVTLSAAYTPPTGVNLCLNGHAVKQGGSVNVVSVSANVAFTLTDCGTTKHYFTVGDGGLWTLNTSASSGTDYDTLTARPTAGTVVAVKGGAITGGTGVNCGGNYASGGGVLVNGNDGVFTMYGGNVVGNSAGYFGGGVSVGVNVTGTAKINGGRIIGNTSDQCGGGVHGHNMATLEISGGDVSFNYAGGYGGGVMPYASFTMQGGLVRYNHAANYGGGVDMEQGTDVVLGGSIVGNVAGSGNGGGFRKKSGSLTLGGSVCITNNTANGASDNLYLLASQTFSVSSETPLAADASVGVKTATAPAASSPVAISSNGAAADAAHFTSDAAYDVAYSSGHLVLAVAVTFTPTAVDHATASVYVDDVAVAKTGESYKLLEGATAKVVYAAGSGYCFAGGVTAVTNAIDTSTDPATADAPAKIFVECATWADVKTNLLAGTNVLLTADVSITDQNDALAVNYKLTSGKTYDVTFDLNGHTVDAYNGGNTAGEKDRVFILNGSAADYALTICDSAGGGAFVGHKQVSGHAGGFAFVADNCKLTLNGGTIRGFSSSGNGGAIALYATGTFEMNGGTITNCTAGGSGGAIYNQQGKVTLNGGTIVGYAGKTSVVALNNSVSFVISGGVYDTDPGVSASGATFASGYSSTQVGSLWVVGKGVTQADGALTGGTFNFDPTADEYAAAGLKVGSHFAAVANGTDPETWTVIAKYCAPVYVDNVASNGIAYWTTNNVPSGYTVVESAASRVKWGTAGETSWYVVTNGTFTIKGVNCQGHVHLVLCDGAKLAVVNMDYDDAGIHTDANGSFTIYGTPDGSGELSATATDVDGNGSGAGIGGEENDCDGSAITINGGTVTATGSNFAAGIGGSCYGAGSSITINGGTVTATGGDDAAGIGGGYRDEGSSITINGGTVTATGSDTAAGIGGGRQGAGSSITINGGTVVATGAENAAGIGGGWYGAGSNIAINGGTVWVANDGSCELIGSGEDGSAASGVTIAAEAEVMFDLVGGADGGRGATALPAWEGFAILTPETPVTRVLVGGIDGDGPHGVRALPWAITNAVTAATSNITVNGSMVLFANKLLSLPLADGKLTLTAVDYSTINPPTEVAHATAKVCTNGVEVAVGTGIIVPKDTTATVVYVADAGYYFADGSTEKTVAIDTATNPATTTAPAAPIKVEIAGVTARQRYPWNGKVDIAYTATNVLAVAAAKGVDVQLAVMAIDKNTTPWTTNVAEAACLFDGPRGARTLPLTDALSNGTHRIVWDMNAQGLTFASTNVDFAVSAEELGGVQLWKDGPLWAESNVGAAKPEAYGYYFWWGDTVGYTLSGGKWVSSRDGTTTISFHYNASPAKSTDSKDNATLQAEGYIDGTGNLVAAHDAATARLGAPWRMPTGDEVDTLTSKCTCSQTDNWQGTGVAGYVLTGTEEGYTDKSIFIPAAGYGYASTIYASSSEGKCWSSTPHPSNTYRAGYLNVFMGDNPCVFKDHGDRYYGQAVRPVRAFTGATQAGAGTLCAGVAAQVKLDLATGARVVTGTETLTYSTEWDGGTSVALAANGETLAGAEALTGGGTYDWTPIDGGIVALTHTTTGGDASVLTANFVVPGNVAFTAKSGAVTLSATKNWDGTMHASTNGVDWFVWEGEEIVSQGSTIKVRGFGNTVVSKGTAWSLTGTEIAAEGDIASLLDGAKYAQGVEPPAGAKAFWGLFKDCAALVKTPTLSLKNCGGDQFYCSMFRNCTALTEAPEVYLTNTCYQCCQNMFSGCGALTNGPSVLPAMRVAGYAYSSMFEYCSALKHVPSISAIALDDGACSWMFSSCRALTRLPDLLATNLSFFCYRETFSSDIGVKLYSPGVGESWSIPSNAVASTNWKLNMFSGVAVPAGCPTPGVTYYYEPCPTFKLTVPGVDHVTVALAYGDDFVRPGEAIGSAAGAYDVYSNYTVRVVYTAEHGYYFTDFVSCVTQEVVLATGAKTVEQAAPTAHEHEGVVFALPIATEAELRAFLKETDTGYLTADVSLLGEDPATVATCVTNRLCLNGHVITRDCTSATNYVFMLEKDAMLAVYDCDDAPHYFAVDEETKRWIPTNAVTDKVVKGGYVCGGLHRGVKLYEPSYDEQFAGGIYSGLEWHGGTLVGCSGGGVLGPYAKVLVTGGGFVGNTQYQYFYDIYLDKYVLTDANAAIDLHCAEFKMTGGELRANCGYYRAGIHMSYSTAEITGGVFAENEANYAAAIYADDTALALGGDVLVTNNVATQYGAIYVEGGSLDVRDRARVVGNTDSDLCSGIFCVPEADMHVVLSGDVQIAGNEVGDLVIFEEFGCRPAVDLSGLTSGARVCVAACAAGGGEVVAVIPETAAEPFLYATNVTAAAFAQLGASFADQYLERKDNGDLYLHARLISQPAAGNAFTYKLDKKHYEGGAGDGTVAYQWYPAEFIASVVTGDTPDRPTSLWGVYEPSATFDRATQTWSGAYDPYNNEYVYAGFNAKKGSEVTLAVKKAIPDDSEFFVGVYGVDESTAVFECVGTEGDMYLYRGTAPTSAGCFLAVEGTPGTVFVVSNLVASTDVVDYGHPLAGQTAAAFDFSAIGATENDGTIACVASFIDQDGATTNFTMTSEIVGFHLNRDEEGCVIGYFDTAIATLADLEALCQTGGYGYLTADVVFPTGTVVAVSADVKLCLAGHALVCGYDAETETGFSGGATLAFSDCGEGMSELDLGRSEWDGYGVEGSGTFRDEIDPALLDTDGGYRAFDNDNSTWTAAKAWAVTFDLRDGTSAVVTNYVKRGAAIAKPSPDPTLEGQAFGGWYTDSACTAAYDFATPVTADLALYAKWSTPGAAVENEDGELVPAADLEDAIGKAPGGGVVVSTNEKPSAGLKIEKEVIITTDDATNFDGVPVGDGLVKTNSVGAAGNVVVVGRFVGETVTVVRERKADVVETPTAAGVAAEDWTVLTNLAVEVSQTGIYEALAEKTKTNLVERALEIEPQSDAVIVTVNLDVTPVDVKKSADSYVKYTYDAQPVATIVSVKNGATNTVATGVELEANSDFAKDAWFQVTLPCAGMMPVSVVHKLSDGSFDEYAKGTDGAKPADPAAPKTFIHNAVAQTVTFWTQENSEFSVLAVPPTEITLTYDAMGGAFAGGADSATVTQLDVETYAFPSAPARAGYAFAGWFDGVTNGAPQKSAGEAIGATRLFAKWTLDDAALAGKFSGVAQDAYSVTSVTANQVIATADFAVPDRDADGKAIVAIGRNAFTPAVYAGAVTNVSIGAFVTVVRPYAFYKTALTNVAFAVPHDYLTGAKTTLELQDYAFAKTKLTTLTFPAGGTYLLGNRTFDGVGTVEDVYFYGTLAKESWDLSPFHRIGEDLGVDDATGEQKKVTFHLNPSQAADAAFVRALTNGVANAAVQLDQTALGDVDYSDVDRSAAGYVSVTFKLSGNAPWTTVTADTVYMLYGSDANEVVVGTGCVAKPTALERLAGGAYKATFAEPAAPAEGALFFRICVGE